MNQEKFGQFIKDIRKNNNLTQKELADSLGVTYQAVSKWETGKNMPDILMIKEICNRYNMSVDEFLDSDINHKKKIKKESLILITILFIIFIMLIIFLFLNRNDNDFEFKTLSSSCESFNLTGSIAYNKSKGSIYISHITYCGTEFSNQKFKKINCSLYEQNGDNITRLVTNSYDGKEITLEEYLKDVTFNVNEFEKTCNTYSENSLYLEIEAPGDNGYIFTHKIPLKFDESCKTN